MNGEEIVILVWLVLVVLAFVGCYRATKKIVPNSRSEPKAWLKAAARSFPWAFLLTPSMAFGAISFPMPAGLLIVGWLWRIISRAPYVEGPHNATGPIACGAFTIAWAVIFVATLLGLRLAGEPAQKS